MYADTLFLFWTCALGHINRNSLTRCDRTGSSMRWADESQFRGRLSTFKRHLSGHHTLTLHDQPALFTATMPEGAVPLVTFYPGHDAVGPTACAPRTTHSEQRILTRHFHREKMRPISPPGAFYSVRQMRAS